MHITYLTETSKSASYVTQFLGYNHTYAVTDGEFYDTKNISTDDYPTLTPRDPRGYSGFTTEEPQGLASKMGLLWADKNHIFYKGEDITPTWVDDETYEDKTIVSMGGYIVVFPDKMRYNTVTGVWDALENEWSGSVSIEQISLNVEVDAEYQDVIIASDTYVKISGTGIGTGFNRYDAIDISGCTTLTDLNKSCIIADVDENFITVVGLAPTETSETITVKRSVPDMEFVVEQNNRLWGCNSEMNEIYACRLGDPKNWRAYEGLSGDSYAVSCGSDGKFTGACVLGGYILFFKENGVHKVYGSRPANFQVTYTSLLGVEDGSSKSVCVLNDILYYKSRSGIMAMSSGNPKNISNVLGATRYYNAVGGGVGSKYYVCMHDKNGEATLFVYDTEKGLWIKEDNTDVDCFAKVDETLYYIDKDTNKIMSVKGGDAEIVDWYAETGDLIGADPNKQYISKLQFRLELEPNATFNIEMKYSEHGTWEKVYATRTIGKRGFLVPIIPRRSGYVAVRVSGQGQCRLYAVKKAVEEGSEL